jgi:hypothetical protein
VTNIFTNNIVGYEAHAGYFHFKISAIFTISMHFELPIGHMFRIGRVSVCSQWMITLNKISINTLMP